MERKSKLRNLKNCEEQMKNIQKKLAFQKDKLKDWNYNFALCGCTESQEVIRREIDKQLEELAREEMAIFRLYELLNRIGKLYKDYEEAIMNDNKTKRIRYKEKQRG